MSTQNAIPHLWLETPLIRSNHISSLLGTSAYLKLENLQPSQSFKFRGISLFAQHCKTTRGPSVHLIIASSGNAGLAAACASNVLEVKCTVFLPMGASESMIESLKVQKAEVCVAGNIYAEARREAEEAVKKDSNAVIIPAYDDPIVWQGHASMIREIASQLPASVNKPDAIFCSVGGSGLLGGVIVGCKDVGWDDIPIVALETQGCDCFQYSMSANGGRALPEGIDVVYDETHDVKLAHMNQLTSLASSLGATSPAAGVVKMASHRKGGVRCVSVPDEMSMHAACQFAEDHKFMVELACSTTLTPAYNPSLFSRLFPSSSGPKPKTLVFIVCGGVKITLSEMESYHRIVQQELKTACSEAGTDEERCWEVLCDGERWSVPKQ